jgi:serine/threonine protein phosphatase PrpC
MHDEQQERIAHALLEELARQLAAAELISGDRQDRDALLDDPALLGIARTLVTNARQIVVGRPEKASQRPDPGSSDAEQHAPDAPSAQDAAENQSPADDNEQRPSAEDAREEVSEASPGDAAPPASGAAAALPQRASSSSGEDDAEPARTSDGVAATRETKSTRVDFAVTENARVDEPFRANLIARGDAPDTIEITDCEMPAGLGLTFDPATALISGIPNTSGEHALAVSYRFRDQADDRPPLTATARLTVNPDPRSLWQTHPSDQAAPGWKPDADCALVEAGSGRRIVAASKRGRSHAHIGGFRDDDFCIVATDSSPWSVLAVADGAGSAERARIGAQLAASAGAERAALHLAGQLGETIVRQARAASFGAAVSRQLREAAYEALGGAALAAVKAIEDAAEHASASMRDYATTLLLVGHHALDEGHLVIAFWVGDGAAALLEPNRVQLLGVPDGGAFAGQTRFLDRSIVGDANEIMSRIHVAMADDLTGLLLMSDGISDAYFASDRELADHAAWQVLWDELAPLLGGARPAEDLLDWLDFWSPGNHDDRTIAVLW